MPATPRPLVQAVQDGQVPLATLREMARRILTEMFRFHLFSARRGRVGPRGGHQSRACRGRAEA